jgi:hypothetical protein
MGCTYEEKQDTEDKYNKDFAEREKAAGERAKAYLKNHLMEKWTDMV